MKKYILVEILGTHQGRFSSPGYPSGTYPNKERCTWIVKSATELPCGDLLHGRFVRIDLVTDELNAKSGFLAHFYSVSPDGVTPSSFDPDADKHLKSIPPPTDEPKKGGNSTVMIAVICSLLGVVLIGLILLLMYFKKNKRARENQTRTTQLQLASPVSGASSQRNHAQPPLGSPPPYSSVVANAPPPYSSSATVHSVPRYT
ncbi:hypothetical protein OS493_019427 [Desmophyllum pertusum]|uniref:CUB domain-containing protein n=1 Tax=Desmophyllum pertusum TaxID=174260 RepID=A0A9X0A1C8_9CNID|nr:hypothetical protein OS493_019427 [Desmophyllum pertusum]